VSLYKQVLQDNPVGFWPLDEASGTTANDRSGNGRNGTATAGVTPHAGYAGMRAFDFDADSNHNVAIAHNAALAPTGDMTIEFWSYLDTDVANSGLGKGFSWRVSPASDGVYFYIEQSSGSYWRYARMGWTSTQEVGNMHHVVCTFDSTANTFSFVWNGIAQTPVATGGPTGTRNTTDTNSVLLGQYPGFGTLDGRLWGVALYNTVLPLSRAQMHYRAGLRSGVVAP
jgi:hypothetical protein